MTQTGESLEFCITSSFSISSEVLFYFVLGVLLLILRCHFFDEKDKKAKENCPNCHNWVEHECLKHLAIAKEQRHDALDKEMRNNKAAWLQY